MSLGWIDHFEVLRFLGRGGMSDVYLAHDAHLDCDVALKLLHEDRAWDAAHRDRLLREARSLAKLDHPNIVGIYDCGEVAPRPPGFLWPDQPGPHPEKVVYLAMHYVEGTDLTETIAARRMSVGHAVDCAIQIARGLGAAHAQHVVHRDLKPANIRVTPGGVLKIVDFGLASSHRRLADSLDPTQSLTREIIIGTVGYSAPEQGEEAGHADPRCDLFSLGVILYEMVTGTRPFEGDSVIAVLRDIALRDPVPMRNHTPGVPDELQRIVGMLMQKDPARRYPSADAVLADLVRLRDTIEKPAPVSWRRHLGPVLTAIGLVALLAGTVEIVRQCDGGRPPETLAVVGFENLTGDARMDRLASGLGLDLVTSLVQGCRVTVVSSTLRDAEGRPDRDPGKLGREYGAKHILLGSLHEEPPGGSGTRLSLHVQIVRTSDRSTEWAREWDVSWGDFAKLRKLMTEALVQFWPRVPSAEASPIDSAPKRPGLADEAYLRGLALFWDTDPVMRDSSIVEFDRALALDPEFGRALAYRARAKLARYLMDRDTTRLAPAEQDARRAAKIPASRIEGGVSLARVLRERGRTAESIEELQAVVGLNDRYAEAYTELGNAHAKLGDMARARGYYRQSLELQPANIRAWRAYGRFLLQVVSDLPEAEKAYRMELKLAPGENRGYETVAAVLVKQCRYAEALEMYAKRPKPEAKSTDLAGNRGVAYYYVGNFELALKDFLSAVSAAPEDGNWRINLGDVYAHLGRREEALREFREARRLFERDVVADPEDLVWRARLAKALAKSGEPVRARSQADTCVAAGPWRNAEVVHNLAMTFAICGERERALTALDTLLNARGFSKCEVAAEEEFVSLRGDARFKALVGDTKP